MTEEIVTEASADDDIQARRYDVKVRRLLQECVDTSHIDEDEGSITFSLEAWESLEKGAGRELLPGDLLLFAQQYPGKVLAAAKRLYKDKAWVARANADGKK